MRKAQEIELLREVAAKLGPDSYCGPWLASVIAEVESEVRSDFFPTPTIAATRKDCVSMIAMATEAAAKIEADARAKADKSIRATEDRIEALQERTRSELAHAIKTLGGW